jgi:hypothetical protein
MRRSLPAALSLAAFVGASITSLVLAEPSSAPEGLELSLTTTTKKVWPCGPVEWDLVLANRSKSASHKVVLANDGSESGMREPHVWFTATHVGRDGVATELEPHPALRCGLYADQWWKDVATLAPGESRKLEWAPMRPEQTFDYQAPGKLILVAHYAWKGGGDTKNLFEIKPPDDLGGMKGVAPYEIASKPIEVEVIRPLDVVAKAKGSFKSGVPKAVTDVLDVRVVNASGEPISLSGDTWFLTVETCVGGKPRHAFLDETKGDAKSVTLPAGGDAAVLGAAGFLKTRDARLQFEGACVVRMRVGLTRTLPDRAVVRSEFVEVKVEE